MTTLLVSSVLLGEAAFGWVFLTLRGIASPCTGRVLLVNWPQTANATSVAICHFEQVCFPGVHADIGGGDLENEAGWDVALNWTVAGASLIPDRLKHDQSFLQLSPDPAGPQHKEQAGGLLKAGMRCLPVDPNAVESTSDAQIRQCAPWRQGRSCCTTDGKLSSQQHERTRRLQALLRSDHTDPPRLGR
ncbi:DUF2235 domain-containing protein [Bradyrhizobium sp. CCBAU 21359]|uniref:DUF2235 domain-containing protein n=1 Tax=Bradyrhizobium sp. CCBAU 21359 TaxID=1325080 RepID=UPI0023058063|nr:DUF2235 domain-containing protein [Bradyrhizobium sp. CCBAU 21359]